MPDLSPLATLYRRAFATVRMGIRSGVAFGPNKPRAAIEAARMRLRGPLSLPSLFRVHAAAKPDADAVVFGDRRYTFGELDERIDRLAHGLAARGIRSGDAALIALHNRPEFIEAQAALARLGASAVSVSFRSTVEELEYLAQHSRARGMIVDAGNAEPCAAAADRLQLDARLRIVVGGGHPGFTAFEEVLSSDRSRLDGQEGAVVIYTSGTTGKPKGAVRTFPKEMAWAVIHVLDELPFRVDDRHLVVCPMYHSTAFGFASLTLTLGGTLVVEPSFDPERFLAVIERHRITTTAVVPTMLHRVLQLPEETLRRYDTRSLRAIFAGGAPLSGTLARRVIERFGHVLYNFYGATETGLNTIATPDELLRSPGTIGHVIPGNEIRLLDDTGREVPDGSTGELFVANAMLVSGYHDDEAATKASLRDGFFSVGDLAHRDANGLFHIDGRKRDMIISGGVNVYPAEVEEVLHRHPEVQEVAVIGLASEEWGETVCACVVATPAFDETEFISWAKQRLAAPKVPRVIRVMEALPKNPTGKVLKRELRTSI